ncbi:phosphoglucomutase/phosphomannomutase family protein [Thermovibrio ammonificans]|uniref:Phosphoglucomutase/phosphomannomutase alpha/beta/alpha domain I n=1 Tax=Thermovibrio ammonificans (strain DSM 15698 / JCM 12110 / HB-1) TaxID=648996 RepID=E8T3B3_THEA1|nr:phosphoglucomutase/phosphomannomutase family protein [Thermovibrio ammonificans]ADU97245.1 phosphoglucomutase/phosphomannomutase alpha/beta/alpha domain I [Thermovibrio ammonificans HB-1]
MIKFGTDGWRGVISREFTFDNLRKVALAHGKLLKEQGAKRVVVGYDLRFLSEEYGRFVAEIFAGMGFETVLSDGFCPTPAVSYNTKYGNFDNGVVITASHNYGKYNGYKVKESFGGAARTEFTKEIEKRIPEVESLEAPKGEPKLEDLVTPYVEGARSQIELSLFKEKSVKIVHDPMYGAQQGCFVKALVGTKAEVTEIHAYRDPLFGGKHPEPIVEENITALMEKVRALKADIGIANDGDGDRVGIVNEKGEFVNSQIVYALLLLHIIRNKGRREGVVVKTVSTGYLVDRICRKLGIELIEVPVGFKNITEVILRQKVLFGGEESGGYALVDYLPERDGLLMGLLMVEKMLAEEKSVSQMVEELFKEFGAAYYKRMDLPVTEEERKALERIKENPPKEWEGLKVSKILTIDGVKIIFEDDSWILFRPSGTEPVFRVYAETPEPKRTEKLLSWGVTLVKQR